MDKSIPRLVGNSRLRTLLVGLIGSALILGSQVAAIPSFATESRSLARVDIVVGDGGVIDPDDTNTFSVVVRADETSRAALEDAQQLLSACPDIKLLLNATRFSPSGRRFGDYGV